MRKIKYVLVILIVLLFTGCSGNYNLTFNKDLTVNEELNVSIDNIDDNYEKTHQLFENGNIDRDKYEIVIIDDKVNIRYKEKYKSFADYYLNSNLYKMIFEEIEYKKDNTGMSIKAETNLKLDDKDNQNIINSYDINDLKINITIPFSVNKSNASSVKDNTYTWVLNKNDTYKNISIDYSYKEDKLYGIVILSLIGIAVIATLSYIFTYLLRNNKL